MNQSLPFHTEPDYEITGGFVDGMGKPSFCRARRLLPNIPAVFMCSFLISSWSSTSSLFSFLLLFVLGGIMTAGFAPLIMHEQREEWEQYAVNNQDWIEHSAHLKAVHPVHRDALHGTIQDHEHDRRMLQETDEGISPFIYKWENGEKVSEVSQPGQVLAPLWQISPADYGVVNVNLLSDSRIAEVYEQMNQAESTVLSPNVEIGDMVSTLKHSRWTLLDRLRFH
jgi:hypothetical protein